MNDKEIWEFIESQKTIQVCSLDQHGNPHLVPMWFFTTDKKIILISYSKSQKIVNLKRNPAIAVLLEDGSEYHELRGVSINCMAELVSEPTQVQAMEKKLIARNHPGLTEAAAEEMTSKMSHKKTAIIVTPGKVKSWDHRKLDSDY